MNTTPCNYCGSEERRYRLKLVPSGKPFNYPKYIPQIKEECGDCGRYIKFASQTPELINALNELLEDLTL